MEYIISDEFIRKAVLNLAEDENCKDLHPGSCNHKAYVQMRMGSRSIAPLYLMVHLFQLIMKHKKLKTK